MKKKSEWVLVVASDSNESAVATGSRKEVTSVWKRLRLLYAKADYDIQPTDVNATEYQIFKTGFIKPYLTIHIRKQEHR